MKNLKSLIENKNEIDNIVIVCAGSTLKKDKDALLRFVAKNNSVTIGVNNMSSLLIPDYHIWTNSGRLKEFGNCISNESSLFLGKNITSDLLNKYDNKKSFLVSYSDKRKTKYRYKRGNISGYFRTAGCLSIMISHLLGAKKIYVAGMDGYTFIDKKSIENKTSSQHLYGKGNTDKTTWDQCVEKDKIVDNILNGLKNYGIKFSIITPTVFNNHYNADILI